MKLLLQIDITILIVGFFIILILACKFEKEDWFIKYLFLPYIFLLLAHAPVTLIFTLLKVWNII